MAGDMFEQAIIALVIVVLIIGVVIGGIIFEGIPWIYHHLSFHWK